MVVKQCMGLDVTQLIQSHHLSDTPWEAMKRYEVKAPAGSPDASGTAAQPTYSNDPNGFYLTLRTRVREHFQKKGIRHTNRASASALINMAALGVVFLASWAYLCFAPLTVASGAVVCAVNSYARLMLSGFSHDCIHHSMVPHWPRLQGALFNMFEMFLCINSSRWHAEHVLMHHVHTKTDLDPDETLPLLRLTGKTDHVFLHRIHIATQFFFGLLVTFINCIVEFATAFVEAPNEKLRRDRGMPSRVHPFISLVVLFLFHLAPLATQPRETAFYVIVLSCMTANMITLMGFHIAHIVEESAAIPYKPNVDWGTHQVNTSSNFNSWVFAGTLDLQIEHHLFPSLAYQHQLAIVPIVKQTIKEFGLDYSVFSSGASAMGAHLCVI